MRRARYRFCRLFFTKGLALVYAAAFSSLARQAKGLLGEDGVLPVRLFLRQNDGSVSPLRTPSLFWLGASDGVLVTAAIAGLVLALAALVGVDGTLLWGALWALYLSFVSVGQVFYQYPGDLLLLEVGFLAVFLPGRPLARFQRREDPPEILVWLLRFLLFRVLVGTGIAKLRSDPCWSGLTCLPGYLETQPAPTVLAFYAHALPLPIQRMATFAVLFSEIVVPFGVFGPRLVRRAAGAVTIVVQGLSLLVANGGYASWLVALAALACFDDEFFALRLPSSLVEGEAREAPGRARAVVLRALALGVAGLALAQAGAFWSPAPGGAPSIEPLHLVNVYGAIESVETERNEVVFEGTSDDVALGPAHFVEYELPCKPGDPRRAPCWPTLNPRRLDLRLWQAALGDFRREEWVVRVVDGLLRGDRSVTALFERNPFAGKPPRFVRARRYRYRFATHGESPYWYREPLDDFIRPISLEDPALYEYLFHKGWLPK